MFTVLQMCVFCWGCCNVRTKTREYPVATYGRLHVRYSCATLLVMVHSCPYAPSGRPDFGAALLTAEIGLLPEVRQW